jgi:hypothetical protein
MLIYSRACYDEPSYFEMVLELSLIFIVINLSVAKLGENCLNLIKQSNHKSILVYLFIYL